MSRQYSQCLEAGLEPPAVQDGGSAQLRPPGHYDLSPQVYLTLLVAGVKCFCDHTERQEELNEEGSHTCFLVTPQGRRYCLYKNKSSFNLLALKTAVARALGCLVSPRRGKVPLAGAL